MMKNKLEQTNSAWQLMFNMGIKLNSDMTTYSIKKGLKQHKDSSRKWGLTYDDESTKYDLLEAIYKTIFFNLREISILNSSTIFDCSLSEVPLRVDQPRLKGLLHVSQYDLI